MAGFSDNDIEKSPWAVGKARAHDTLAYRGSNIWKCISVPDRGEEGGRWGSKYSSVCSQGKREETALTVTTSYQFPVVGLIFDSSLSKQAILKAIGCVNTPFLHSRSWVDFAIWFGHGTRQIQPCQSSAEASSLGTEWTNTVEWTVGLCSSVILWLTLRKICQLIPHLHCRWTHTESKTHQRWNTNLQCSGNVRESGTDLYSGRSWLWNDGKLELDVAWKEFTRRCVCGGMSCQE